MPYAFNPLDPSFSEEDVARLSEETLALQIPEGYEITEREIERLDELARKHKAPFDVEDEESAAVALDWFLERGVPVFAAELEPNEWVSKSASEDIDQGNSISWGLLSQGRRHGPEDIPIYLIKGATGSDYTGGTYALSNYQVIGDLVFGDDDGSDFSDDQLLFQEYVIRIWGGHDTRGFALRLDKGPIPQELLGIANELSEDDTTLLDEDHHSMLEHEFIWETDWPQNGRDEWRDALKRAFPDHADDIDDLDVSNIDDLFEGVAHLLSESPWIDDQFNVHYPFDEAVSHLTVEDIEDAIAYQEA